MYALYHVSRVAIRNQVKNIYVAYFIIWLCVCVCVGLVCMFVCELFLLHIKYYSPPPLDVHTLAICVRGPASHIMYESILYLLSHRTFLFVLFGCVCVFRVFKILQKVNTRSHHAVCV